MATKALPKTEYDVEPNALSKTGINSGSISLPKVPIAAACTKVFLSVLANSIILRIASLLENLLIKSIFSKANILILYEGSSKAFTIALKAFLSSCFLATSSKASLLCT